jgi:hypothetical protein
MLQVAHAPKRPAVKKTHNKEKASKPASASPRVKSVKDAFMFFSADKSAALKGERDVDHTIAVPWKHTAWLLAHRMCIFSGGS